MALEQFVTICNYSVKDSGGTTSTEKCSRNIPNIGKSVPDTIFHINIIFLIPNNIRNNLYVPDIMRNHFTNVPNIVMPILIS